MENRKIVATIIALLAILLLVLNLELLTSKKFAAETWKTKGVDWQTTDFREKMVNDLIESDTLIGRNRNGVIELLGTPTRQNVQQFQYLVREKYGWDIDPEYIKYLIVEFDKNQVVVSCEIEIGR